MAFGIDIVADFAAITRGWLTLVGNRDRAHQELSSAHATAAPRRRMNHQNESAPGTRADVAESARQGVGVLSSALQRSAAWDPAAAHQFATTLRYRSLNPSLTTSVIRHAPGLTRRVIIVAFVLTVAACSSIGRVRLRPFEPPPEAIVERDAARRFAEEARLCRGISEAERHYADSVRSRHETAGTVAAIGAGLTTLASAIATGVVARMDDGDPMTTTSGDRDRALGMVILSAGLGAVTTITAIFTQNQTPSASAARTAAVQIDSRIAEETTALIQTVRRPPAERPELVEGVIVRLRQACDGALQGADVPMPEWPRGEPAVLDLLRRLERRIPSPPTPREEERPNRGETRPREEVSQISLTCPVGQSWGECSPRRLPNDRPLTIHYRISPSAAECRAWYVRGLRIHFGRSPITQAERDGAALLAESDAQHSPVEGEVTLDADPAGRTLYYSAGWTNNRCDGGGTSTGTVGGGMRIDATVSWDPVQ